jgi:hypothetical protein
MGKQVKDEFGFVADDQEIIKPPAESQDLGFVPDTEPVKKKDVSASKSPSLDASSTPAEPSKKSSTKPISTAEIAGDAIKSVSPLGKMVYDAGRRILSGLTDDLPKSLAQGLEVAKSSVSPKNVAEYIRNSKSVDFQDYVREKENIPWYKPFGDEGFNKYIDKYGEQFMVDAGLGDLSAKLKENEQKVVERRLKVEKYAQQQTEEAAQKMGGATQSLSEIRNLNDVASYIGTLGGQAAYQIPLAALTRAASSLLQESATVYDQQIDNLAKDKGISREQVISQGLDKPAEGQAYAVLAAGLDAVSAGNIVNAMRAQGGSLAKKWATTAIPEAITEPVQGVLEDVGAATGDKVEALGEAITSPKRLDELAGGIVGGSAGVFASGPNQAEVIKEATAEAQTSDQASIEAAADKIEFKPDINETKAKEPEPAAEGIEQRSPAETSPVSERAGGGAEVQQTEPVDVNASVQQGSEDTAGNAVVDRPSEKEEQQPETPAESTAQTGSAALDQPESEKISGIKKALVSEEKIAGTQVERRSTEEMLTRAKAQVDAGEINPKAVVDEIATGNARALQPDEVAGLVYYKTQLDNRSDKLNAEMVQAIEAGDQQAQTAIQAQISAVNQEIDAYETMAVKTAYEQSLAFRLRQMLLNNEYNLQTQINKYKAANNGVITPEVEQRFKVLDAELKAANAKIQKLEESRASTADVEELQRLRQDAQRQREARVKTAQARKEKINTFFDSLKVKTDPGKLNSITQVVGETVWNGSVEAMRKAVLAGSDVATAIQAGIDYVKEHYLGTDFDTDAYTTAVQPGIQKLIPDEVAKPEIRNGKLHIPNSTIRSFVEGGAKDINELTDQLHEEVVKIAPDATKREVRDAITKYGETRNLSKEEISVKLREMRRMGKLISALEDVQNKIRPLRSGLQRDKLTDQERRLQRQVKEGMKDIQVSEDEQAKAWKNALDAAKSRLQNQIKDLENQIKTGEKPTKKEGIKYDDEAKALQDQRDALKKIIQDAEGPGRMSDEQRTRMAITAVKKNIDDLQRRIKEKDTRQKDKTTTVVTPELQALRDQRDALHKDYQQMEKDLGVAEQKRLQAYKKSIGSSISKYEQRIKDNDFVTEKKKPVELDDEGRKLRMARDKIKEQFQTLQEKNRLANRSMGEKIWDTAMEVWNIPKSLLATIDMSAPFRQGAILSAANPAEGGRSTVEMFRQAFSQKKADEWLFAVKESPEYAVMKQAKLYLAEPTTKMTAKEEQFLSNFASKIPVLGPLVKGSERAYTGYLNKLRVDVFANGVGVLKDQQMTPESHPEAYKALASFINNATGRGNLGGMEMAAPVLNGLFFSPRYVASRVNLLNPVTYAKMPAPVRKMALKSMLSFIGFGTITLMLASAAGADVEEDPRSSDFGKMKFGDTRYDVWAGFQQIIRLIAQISTGKRKSTKTGKITKLDGTEFPFETRADIALKFGRSKLSPSAGTVADLLTGETMDGQEVTLKDEVIKNVLPLYIQDMSELIQKDGATGLLTSAVPAFFGVGVQDYSGEYGLESEQIDDTEITKLNKKNSYSFAKPKASGLSQSFDRPVDDDLFQKYKDLREAEIKRLFDRYKFRLELIEDKDIYDKMMDDIVREANRDAKYKIARENKWETKPFAPGDKFKLHKYKKNDADEVVRR